MKICGGIRSFVFIAGVVNSSDKLFIGVSDTGHNKKNFLSQKFFIYLVSDSLYL
jgi:hypothetical protein